MKRFVKINDGFLCNFCNHYNPPAESTCRDHCRKCLQSLHIDINPGDRAEKCHGALIPTAIDVKRGSMESIIFRCAKCGVLRKNKIALDDDRSALLRLFET